MKLRLLDLFCGAGGCSEGYQRAGFSPYGIDNDPKPLRHYPFPFLQMDALEAIDRLLAGEGLTFSNGETLYLEDFVAIHASPPCQEYSRTKSLHPHFSYPDLLADVRTRLISTGQNWLIENVIGAPFQHWIMLCGMMFGLRTYRHRRFETSFLMMQPEHPKHIEKVLNRGYDPDWGGFFCVTGGGNAPVAVMKKAIGIDWMTRKEFTQAIPPAYTEYIGGFLMEAVLNEIQTHPV
jgi:DNA (cytosine-5)-methyltransferase 1